jgi:hypothetical protein
MYCWLKTFPILGWQGQFERQQHENVMELLRAAEQAFGSAGIDVVLCSTWVGMSDSPQKRLGPASPPKQRAMERHHGLTV